MHSQVSGFAVNVQKKLAELLQIIQATYPSTRLWPIDATLRLLALISLTQGGFAAADYARLKKSVCEAYGFRCSTAAASLFRMNMVLSIKELLMQASRHSGHDERAGTVCIQG